jgi:hypothetical protein
MSETDEPARDVWAGHASRTLLVAKDMLTAREREGHCPLCGAIMPDCKHILWAKATVNRL